ncbi:methyltransferase domain-containing protein [Nocardioides dubius]|uniref:Trans-aconitate 2-methyltransferase n=1 Tax=Nocardioides dubius TaxID=317019 RepID=A0ABP4EDI8_9ACTN
MPWSPDHYLRYGDERSRPFFDLVARIDADAPREIVDLGCGPGNLTRTLAERWPQAQVLGIDSSPEMVAAAEAARSEGGRNDASRSETSTARRLSFACADLRSWAAEPGEVDVLLSNATLQWVPEHRELLPALAGKVRPSGWLAVQVPGNHGAPSHALCRELAAEEPFVRFTAGVDYRPTADPADYFADLQGLGLTVDAWETTYLHVLHGQDAVFDWVSATGARPYLEAVPDELRDDFVAAYKRRLAVAYPERDGVVLLPFRRVFVVAHRSM